MAYTPRSEFERPDKPTEMTPEETKEALSEPEQVGEVDPAEVMEPLHWYILIRPKQPKRESDGGIILTPDTQEAQEHLVFCGQVLKTGGLAFQAKTRAGLDLGAQPNLPQIGDWVVFGQYAGQRMELQDESTVLILADTEILGITRHPERFRHYI